MSKSMRKITYYENILEFKENTKEQLSLNEINNWHLCRTCLIETSDADLDLDKMSVMDVMEGSFLSIEEMLNKTTNIKMTSMEKLPLKVCKECFNKITALYYFSLQVRKADKVLIRMASKLKGFKDESPVCESKEKVEDNKISILKNENNSIESELPESSVLIEVEELYNCSENYESIINQSAGENKFCEEETLTEELDKIDDKKCSDFFEEIDDQIEAEFLADEENYSCEEETYLDQDLLYDTQTSEEEVVEAKPRKDTKSKKRSNKKVASMPGYKHKQPRITSPLLHDISCVICQRSFERQQDLVSHVRQSHPNSKAYKCRVCGNLFSHIQSLSRHMNSHKTELVFNQCEHCSKTFVRSDDLKRHLRVHTGERPYFCTLCDKSFQQITDLKIHKDRHHNPQHLTKVYKCEECQQTYTSRNGLYLHTKKYHKEGTDGFGCSLCEMTFFSKRDLNNHEKAHDQSKVLECDQCGLSYASQYALNRHHKKCKQINDSYIEKSFEKEDEYTINEKDEIVFKNKRIKMSLEEVLSTIDDDGDETK